MHLANLMSPIDVFNKLSKPNLVWLQWQEDIYTSSVSYYHFLILSD